MVSYQTPGVFREDIFPAPAAELRTGVPAFLGYAGEASREADRIPFYQPWPLTLWPQFVQHFGQPAPARYLAYAVRGFFENGGELCYVVRLDEKTDAQKGLEDGLAALEPLDSIDLVCAPDIMKKLEEMKLEVALDLQKLVLDHCDKAGDRLAILDALPGTEAQKILEQRQGLKGANGALYFPWIKVPNACHLCHGTGKVEVKGQSPPDTCKQCQGSGAGFVPPCGHVAGVYARADGRVGVHKAPANEILEGVLDLEVNLTGIQQGPLNQAGVNCLRAFPGRGLRVWGARTLAGGEQAEWTYVNVRRLFLTAGRWVERSMADAVFEPNGPRLWARVERELSAYFEDLFQRGALLGGSAREAFYVKCDAETNPPRVRDLGQVVTEIGLAPAAPAEFVVVRIVHGASGVTISGPVRPEQ